MNLKLSFYVSLVFYTCMLIILYSANSKQEDITKIQIQRGTTGFISFVFSNSADGLGQNPKTEKFSSLEGTVAEEIDKIQNKISYPPQALEDGLESECEWSLVIDSRKKASQIKTIHPCKYKIFEEEFRRVISDWEFTLPENTVLQIPVKFKIQ
ncbi:MAG: energy transducer TonB [Leptospiraceae bacterium]|nr:energy transducer TonB [Leptospiraceae bacterium]